MSKRIAVIGSGISGLVSAYMLNARYDVTLFESNDYLGGHTHTVDVRINDNHYAIDTGFIVFNQKNYPHFTKLLDSLSVPFQLSEMSFSYRSDAQKLEYNGHNINTLFADRRLLLKPKFYRFISQILKFNRDARNFLRAPNSENISIAEFIKRNQYSKIFIDSYLVPMIASIWSANPADVLYSSAYFILKFYDNHGLLSVSNQPKWYVVVGGSRSYVPRIIASFKDKIYLSTKIEKIIRKPHAVILQSKQDQFEFDEVVIATHSDQALDMLENPSAEELTILGAIPYSNNEVILHTDISVLPKQTRAWASWNYFDTGASKPSLTYYMNRLQSIQSDIHFCVSMNLNEHIAKDKIIRKFNYAHPCFNLNCFEAQRQFETINGKNRTYYAGAYWRYGFHEDGVLSALAACKPLGVSL